MYSRHKDTLVPTQLQRSMCRKDLSRLCGEVIKEVVLQRIQEDATLELEELHQALSRVKGMLGRGRFLWTDL